MNSVQLSRICETCKQEKQRQLFIDLYREKEYKHCYECRLNFINTLPTKRCMVCKTNVNKSEFNYFNREHKICHACHDVLKPNHKHPFNKLVKS